MLFTVIGILFVRLTQMTQCADVDRLLVPWDIKWLRGASGAIGAVFLFFVVVSMSAGVGAMLNQLFHVPTWLGSLVFMAAVFLVTLLGVSGMVNAFSALIPVLIAATVAFAAGAYATFGTEGIFRLKDVNTNPLMPNWVVASLTFVAYNILGGIGIMAPVGQYVRKKKHIYAPGLYKVDDHAHHEHDAQIPEHRVHHRDDLAEAQQTARPRLWWD